MKILCLEAFYGGSHRNFIDNFIAHSSFQIDLFTLPERNWKWRVRAGALHFLELVPNPEDYDLLFLPGTISLADLKAYWGVRCPKTLVYFHETQLSYPLPPGTSEDYLPLMTEMSNALQGDLLLFNSDFHRDSYLKALPGLLDRFPESPPRWVISEIEEKCHVLYPGITLEENDPQGEISAEKKPDGPPIILWNHRWDYDKDPEAFFRVIRKIDPDEINFRLVLLGENAQFTPKVFEYARQRYGSRILQFGWAQSRQEYLDWLKKSSIVVSTAIQENFGIAIAEAAALGVFPLLPNRLVYPELVPKDLSKDILYSDEKMLLERLKTLLQNPPTEKQRGRISEHYLRHQWKYRIVKYDSLMESMMTF